MTEPNHHPGEALLIDYADGNLYEAAALVTATHLAFCPACRRRVSELEAIGGAFLEGEDERPVSEDCLEAVLARLDDPRPAPPASQSVPKPAGGATPPPVPEPLRSYLGAPLDQLCWRPLTRDVGQVDLHLGRGPVRTQLIRIRAGAAAPRHSHTGHELTLVLAGGFQDYRGRFKRGDMVVDDATVDHRPVAEAETDCLCLTVIDAPLKLTGGLMRLFNPLLQLRARA